MRLIPLTILLLILTLPAPGFSADPPPKPRIPLGRDTTYLDGPLDSRGEVDYETALLTHARGKITPDRNAMVLLLQAMGPDPLPTEGKLQANYFAALGMPALPQEGEYYLMVGRIRDKKRRPDPAATLRVSQAFFKSGDAPWKRVDHPELAAWLDSNAKPLDLAVEASRRPDYFNPLVTRVVRNGKLGLMSGIMPQLEITQSICQTLACRAMLRLGEGFPGEAWDDLIAIRRLARLASRGSTHRETDLGFSIERGVAKTDLAFLQHCRFSSKQYQRCVRDLGDLPPFISFADKFELGERVMCLDLLQRLRNGQPEALEPFLGLRQLHLTDDQKQAVANLDWVAIQRSANAWCDKLAAAHRLPDFRSRQQARLAVANSFLELTKGHPGFRTLAQRLFDDPADNVPTPKVGDRLISLMLNHVATYATWMHPADRNAQYVSNLRIALAVSAYRRDHRRYPDKLADLIPTYLAKIEPDLFSNQPPIYRATADEFLLYSVGENGLDNGGNLVLKNSTDDISIRIQSKPLPPVK